MPSRVNLMLSTLLLFTGLGCQKSGEHENEVVPAVQESFISFPGRIYPRRYNIHRDRQNGHHFIVWSEGGAASKAFIESETSDEVILTALEKIGVKPGDNLTEQTWTERRNSDSAEPDKHVKGTRVNIWVEWEGVEHPAHTLFQNINEDQIVIRVGGHRDLIPLWRSGCITCLFSCPGGRTSNAAFTIRDQTQDRVSFYAAEDKLPVDGTEVNVKIELVEEGV